MNSMTEGRLQVVVTKRLGNFLFSCDLDLPLAGLTALFGPSGAGKSTLIALIAGMIRPDSGRVCVDGAVFYDAATRSERHVSARALGVVFQDARLFPHMTAQQNLLFGYKRAGKRLQAPIARFDDVVELLDLAPLLKQRPHTLSGGEKQRVAIGRALLAQPRLLLMDEPLASLDSARKEEVLGYIARLRDHYSVPVLYVSHSMDEVLKLATSLIVLERGRVVAAGDLADLLSRPVLRDRFGAEFGTLLFGRLSWHDDRYGLSTIDCGGFALRVPHIEQAVGTAIRVRIPARDVALTLAPPIDVSTANRIEGSVDSIALDGVTYAEVTVRVNADTVIAARILRESADRLALAPGVRVWCLIKSVALDAGALAIASGTAARRASRSANDDRMHATDGLPL